MKLRRVWAMAWKESLHIIRDARSLGMGIALPMLLLMLFGYALTLDVDNVPLAVWDQSLSPTSRDFISRFDGSRYFQVSQYVRNYADMERAIDSGNAMIGMVIPIDFSRRIESGRPSKVQIIVDGSDSGTATIAMGYADIIANTYSLEVNLDRAKRIGGQTINMPLEVRPRMWFNSDMESRNYIIPGLIAVIMMIIAAMLTSLTVAKEWENGTMEQIISTPIKGGELILGKLLPYFAIGMFDVLLAVLMGEFLFKVPLRGNAALLFAMAAIFLAGALSMGMAISIMAKNQLMASQLAMLTTFLPSFLLSGFMSSIGNMPQAVQVVTYAIPARYFVSLLKGIYLKGAGLEILALEACLLTLFGVLMVALANWKFKKKLV